MKPSERIEQLVKPLRDEALAIARAHVEKLNGGPVAETEWAEYLVSAPMTEAFKQLDLNLKVVALIQYLDEREGHPPT